MRDAPRGDPEPPLIGNTLPRRSSSVSAGTELTAPMTQRLAERKHSVTSGSASTLSRACVEQRLDVLEHGADRLSQNGERRSIGRLCLTEVRHSSHLSGEARDAGLSTEVEAAGIEPASADAPDERLRA